VRDIISFADCRIRSAANTFDTDFLLSGTGIGFPYQPPLNWIIVSTYSVFKVHSYDLNAFGYLLFWSCQHYTTLYILLSSFPLTNLRNSFLRFLGLIFLLSTSFFALLWSCYNVCYLGLSRFRDHYFAFLNWSYIHYTAKLSDCQLLHFARRKYFCRLFCISVFTANPVWVGM